MTSDIFFTFYYPFKLSTNSSIYYLPCFEFIFYFKGKPRHEVQDLNGIEEIELF